MANPLFRSRVIKSLYLAVILLVEEVPAVGGRVRAKYLIESTIQLIVYTFYGPCHTVDHVTIIGLFIGRIFPRSLNFAEPVFRQTSSSKGQGRSGQACKV